MAKFWQIKNEANSDVAEILLYKPIADEDWWDEAVTPQHFHDDLESLNGKDVNVRINCRGGDVFAAQAIYNQLKRYSGTVNVTIDGIAASAATIIACAGKTVTMPSNTTYLIHNPMNMLFGYYNEQELQDMAKALQIVKQTIVNVYKMKCKDKISDEEIIEMMDKETILTADEAKTHGFIDVIDEDNNVKGVLDKGKLIVNSVEFNASSFKNIDKIMQIINKTEQKEFKNMSEPTKKGGFLHKIQEITANLLKPQSNPQNDIDVIAKAKTEERQRIRALNKLRVENNKLINGLIDEAIEDETVTADKIAGYINQIKEAEIGTPAQNMVQNMLKDQIDSGSDNVAVAPKQNLNPDTQAINTLSQALKNQINSKYGGK